MQRSLLHPGRLLLLLLLLLPAITGRAVAESPALTISGESAAVPHPRGWTLAELAALPHLEVKGTEKDGTVVTWSAIPLAKLLAEAGVPQGEQLRGPALALALLVKASDGYQVVFALPELDPAMTDKQVLLADKADGQPLSPALGPLRLVVPDEKRHARWVRQVIGLEIIRVASPGK
jgi:DMSO/TMAO reductase YedYZ molybdopterin-dependent catalytic subunit